MPQRWHYSRLSYTTQALSMRSPPSGRQIWIGSWTNHWRHIHPHCISTSIQHICSLSHSSADSHNILFSDPNERAHSDSLLTTTHEMLDTRRRTPLALNDSTNVYDGPRRSYPSMRRSWWILLIYQKLLQDVVPKGSLCSSYSSVYILIGIIIQWEFSIQLQNKVQMDPLRGGKLQRWRV